MTAEDPRVTAVREAVRGLDPRHPLLEAVRGLLEYRIELETRPAAMPGLLDHQRQFNAGRLANALDAREEWAALLLRVE